MGIEIERVVSLTCSQPVKVLSVAQKFQCCGVKMAEGKIHIPQRKSPLTISLSTS